MIQGQTQTPAEFNQSLREREAFAAMSKEEKKKVLDEIKKKKSAEKAKKKAAKLLAKNWLHRKKL